MWSSALKLLGGILVTFAVVWALVLGWWQSNDYEPGRIDLALYLGALPFALVGGFLLLRGFIDHLQTPVSAAKPAIGEVVDDDPLAPSRAQSDAAERSFSLCLVDAFVEAPGGTSVDEILSAIDSGKRPGPSSSLVDESGFPVFVGDVPGLDIDAFKEKFSAVIGDCRPCFDRDVDFRALALLDGVMTKAHESVMRLLAPGGEGIRLKVIWLVPKRWSVECFPALRSWIQENYWSALRTSDLEISIFPIGRESEALLRLDQVILDVNRDRSAQDLVLIVAADSFIDEIGLAALEHSGKLFSPRHQNQKIPGEAAVALLLATKEILGHLGTEDAISVSRVAFGVRDKSVEAGGRIGGRLLGELVCGLVETGGLEPADVKLVVSDTDHRAGYVTELLEGLGQNFQHLDPIGDCQAIGAVNGATGPVGELIALACARTHVLSLNAPVLCLSNQDEKNRAVLLATPFVANGDPEPCTT